MREDATGSPSSTSPTSPTPQTAHAPRAAPTTAARALVCATALAIALATARGFAAEPVPRAIRPPSSGAWAERTYEGTIDLEAHFRRPGETRRYQSRQRFLTDGERAFRMDWQTWQTGDSTIGPPESDLVLGERVFHRDAPGAPWRELVGERAELTCLRALAGFGPSLAGLAPARGWDVMRGGLQPGLTITARRAHPRLGDVENVVRWSPATATAPAALAVREFERDQSWTLASRLVSEGRPEANDSLLAMPAAFEPAPAGVDSFTTAPRLVAVAPGLWTVDLDDIDSRSLVVEFAGYLAVIEAAIGSANGERIVDAVRARWPAKPIRYAFASHYHPHYMGGLRAFMAEGATIVTTPGNADYVRALAGAKFSLAPDRLARAPRAPTILPFTKRMELADVDNRLVALDIGAASDHTDEFVVFWFPKQRLVFETEQGWITVDGTLRASRRAQGFLNVLDAEGVEADRFVQSWPMRGNRAQVTRAELDSLVAMRNRAAAAPPATPPAR
jgi:glyoxylase-like metal-dependent hydrolase (beta-lactamase superfamily II)